MSVSVHVVCEQCDSVVRVPADKLGNDPHCPKCQQALLSGQPFELRQTSFDRHLHRNDLPWVLDVWAPWCGPCKAMAPQFAGASQALRGRVRFGKLNSDDAPELAGRLGIRSIPTLIVFRQGRELARQSGLMDSQRLQQWLQSVLSLAAPSQRSEGCQ